MRTKKEQKAYNAGFSAAIHEHGLYYSGKYAQHFLEGAKAGKRAKARKDEALRSLGLKKVRGSLGGTYWE